MRCAIRELQTNSPERSQGSAIQEGQNPGTDGTAVVPQRMVRTRYAKSGRGHPGQRAKQNTELGADAGDPLQVDARVTGLIRSCFREPGEPAGRDERHRLGLKCLWVLTTDYFESEVADTNCPQLVLLTAWSTDWLSLVHSDIRAEIAI